VDRRDARNFHFHRHFSLLASEDTPEDARKVADTYQGLAGVFQRIADDAWARASDGDRESERGNDGEVGFLLDFAEKGKTAVVEVKESRS